MLVLEMPIDSLLNCSAIVVRNGVVFIVTTNDSLRRSRFGWWLLRVVSRSCDRLTRSQKLSAPLFAASLVQTGVAHRGWRLRLFARRPRCYRYRLQGPVIDTNLGTRSGSGHGFVVSLHKEPGHALQLSMPWSLGAAPPLFYPTEASTTARQAPASSVNVMHPRAGSRGARQGRNLAGALEIRFMNPHKEILNGIFHLLYLTYGDSSFDSKGDINIASQSSK
jgi:hypothetical protein